MIRKKTVKSRGQKFPTIFVEGVETLFLEVNGVPLRVSTMVDGSRKVIEVEVAQGTEWIFDQPLVVEAHRTHFRIRKHPRQADYCPMCGNEEAKKVLAKPPASRLLECPECSATWYERHGEKVPINRSDAIKHVETAR